MTSAFWRQARTTVPAPRSPAAQRLKQLAATALKVVLLLGVLLMHGLSSGHMLATAATAATADPMMTAHQQPMTGMTADSTKADPAMDLAADPAMDQRMSHGECVAAVPQHPHFKPPTMAGDVGVEPATALLPAMPESVGEARGPPLLTPIRLCISRT